nr:MAG TPA: hypothetical protein [Caudoviricetes sp.]
MVFPNSFTFYHTPFCSSSVFFSNCSIGTMK